MDIVRHIKDLFSPLRQEDFIEIEAVIETWRELRRHNIKVIYDD